MVRKILRTLREVLPLHFTASFCFQFYKKKAFRMARNALKLQLWSVRLMWFSKMRIELPVTFKKPCPALVRSMMHTATRQKFVYLGMKR